MTASMGARAAHAPSAGASAQHLLDDRHREGPAVLALPTEIGRGVYVS
jgi:hypothetical protein